LLVAVAWTCQALMTIRSLPANHRPSKRRHPEPAAAPPPAEAEPDQAEPSGELPESSRDGRPRRTLQPDPAGRFDSEAAGGLDVCEVP
jgi:hypothetical protein